MWHHGSMGRTNVGASSMSDAAVMADAVNIHWFRLPPPPPPVDQSIISSK